MEVSGDERMINLDVVTKFQRKHKNLDIMGVIRTLYPKLEIRVVK